MTDPFEQIAANLPTFDDDAEALLTLRQQAALDPVRGAPMEVTTPQGDVVECEPGKWRIEALADRRTDLPINCPVQPLGTKGKTFFFLNPLGEVHDLTDSSSGKGPIDALFKGRPRYVEWAWPRFAAPKRKSDPWTVKGYEADEARRDLFAACAFKGVFELEDRVRGRGAWRHKDGSLVFHAGDAVWLDGKWRGPGEYSRQIYPGRPPIGRPAAALEPCGEGSAGDILLQGLASWKWDRPELDPRLALGWVMCAMVGGALDQRPLIYVTGGEGTGKSTLQKLLRILMNGALLATSNTTQAGIYQRVQQDSVAVMVDEMEAKEDTRNSDKLLELARIAYSGDKMQRGGKDGVGQEFSVYSSMLFSSIAMPPIDSQDASRMAILRLRERDRPEPGEKPVEILRELGLRNGDRAGELGRQLLRRMFTWFEIEGAEARWDRLLEGFRAALKTAGHSDRAADTFGALAAGCHCALSDTYPDAGELRQWATWLKPEALEETSEKQSTWQRCWWHMMEAQPEVWRASSVKSVGQVLTDWRTWCDDQSDTIDIKKRAEEVNQKLAQVGLAISFPKGADHVFRAARLFVPLKQPALHSLFADTAWAGRQGQPGPWGGVLRQMPQEYWFISTCDRVVNVAQKGLMIELAMVLA